MGTTTLDQATSRGLYSIKPAFVKALGPIERWARSRGITPSQVTAAAIPVEIATAAILVLATWSPVLVVLVPPLAFLWMALNALDGALARSTGLSSRRGAVFNELVDRFGDLLVIGVAFLVAPHAIAALMAVGILTSELVAALDWAINGDRVFVGPMGKPDRAAVVAFGATMLLVWEPALIVAFAVVGVGAIIGALVRVRHLHIGPQAQDGGDAA